MNKRFVVLPLACAAVLSLVLCTGCSPQNTSSSSPSSLSSSGSQESTQVANPMVECKDSAELQSKSGIALTPPEGIQNATFTFIETDGIAQMEFTDANHAWTVRAMQASDMTDISGMMENWQNSLVYTVGAQDITAMWSSGKGCVALGYRPTDMLTFSVGCADETVTAQEAVDLWTSLFYTE